MDKVKLRCTFEGDKLPHYAKQGDSAMDVFAYKYQQVLNGELQEIKDFTKEGFTINPLERVLIKSGLSVEFIDDIDCSCRPRSGMTLKHGLVVQMGMIDNNYRGDIGLIVINLSNEPYTIYKGERVGQLRFSKPVLVELNKVDNINETNRGSSGFGSSGY